MYIKSIVSGLANAARLRQATQSPEKTAAAVHATGGDVAASPRATFRAIVSQYDVTKISPRALSEMLQKLRSAGAISDAELQELSLMRLDLDAQGVDPEKPTNVLDFYADRLRQLQDEQAKSPAAAGSGTAGEASVASVQRRLDWLRKLATVQSSRERAGVDKTI